MDTKMKNGRGALKQQRFADTLEPGMVIEDGGGGYGLIVQVTLEEPTFDHSEPFVTVAYAPLNFGTSVNELISAEYLYSDPVMTVSIEK